MHFNCPSRDMNALVSPSDASIQHRANIAQKLSALRMIRPSVPFWKLAAHRIPTLWVLYRGLMREASTENIRWRIQMYFRSHRHLTSPKQTRVELKTAHKYLNVMREARNGNEHLRRVLMRYDKMIIAKFEKEKTKQMLREAWMHQEKMQHRPIVTGGYIRASFYNKPLPRMRPQPLHITMMLKERRLARDRRGTLYSNLEEWLYDLRAEARFEEDLEKISGVEIQDVFKHAGFREDIQERKRLIRVTMEREVKRLTSPISESLRQLTLEARREKIANKTRERERERRGEITTAGARRMRKRPPPNVLRKMRPEEREMDRISRSPSEVGYVRKVKLRMGFKLKDDTTWRRETGDHLPPDRLRELEQQEDDVLNLSRLKRICLLTAEWLGENSKEMEIVDTFSDYVDERPKDEQPVRDMINGVNVASYYPVKDEEATVLLTSSKGVVGE